MPWTNQLPPDTRTVGSGNPPVDMNAVSEALAASGTTSFNLQNPVFGGADPGTPSTPGADCSTAFQACLTAATAVNGEMVIPPGNYTVNSGINFTGPVRVRGLGGGNTFFGGTLFTGVTLNSGNATGLFRFPYQGYLWGGLEMCGVGIMFTGAGNIFHLPNFADGVFRDCQFTLTQAGSCAVYTTGSVSFLNVLHERCTFVTTNPVRTVPVISISSSIGAAISNNTFFKCKFHNQGLDSTQYAIFIQCTGTGSAYHFADNLRECWFEHPFGGVYKSLSGSNITVDGCVAWDVQTGQAGLATTVAAGSNGGTISAVASWASPSAGVLSVASTAGYPSAGQLNVAASGPTTAIVTYTGVSGNTFTGCAYVSGSPSGTVATGGAVTLSPRVNNSLYYFGAAPSNAGSQSTLITGCGRNLNGPDGAAAWDVEFEATSSNVRVTGYNTSPLSPSTTYNVFFNFHSCQDVVLENNQSPQGAAVNGNSTTVVTNPSPTQLMVSQGQLSPPPHPPTGFAPADLSYLAWTYDPGLVASTALPAFGTVQISRVNVRVQIPVTNIVTYLGVNGSGLTTAQNLMGLYLNDGTRIGITGDQTTNWGAGAPKLVTAALTGGPFTLSPGTYWVAWLANGTTTAPAFGRLNNLSGVIANAGASGAGSMRSGTNVTGVTALPSPLVTASNATAQITFWAALS